MQGSGVVWGLDLESWVKFQYMHNSRLYLSSYFHESHDYITNVHRIFNADAELLWV